MDYSMYIRSKGCCNKSITYNYNNSTINNITKPNVLLFYDDISLSAGDISIIEYNNNNTINNGIKNFISEDNTYNYIIDFSNLSEYNNSIIEIFSHCDATAGNTGSDNYIKLDLSGISVISNSLSIVDIDTRSVSKGDTQHLSFGPVSYKLVTSNTVDNNKCININNTYALRVKTGRDYELSEIKLSMRII